MDLPGLRQTGPILFAAHWRDAGSNRVGRHSTAVHCAMSFTVFELPLHPDCVGTDVAFRAWNRRSGEYAPRTGRLKANLVRERAVCLGQQRSQCCTPRS